MYVSFCFIPCVHIPNRQKIAKESKRVREKNHLMGLSDIMVNMRWVYSKCHYLSNIPKKLKINYHTTSKKKKKSVRLFIYKSAILLRIRVSVCSMKSVTHAKKVMERRKRERIFEGREQEKNEKKTK